MTLVISKGITLDNGTRAAAIAGVSPTLDYRFAREKREIETVSLTDKLTYTGGNGTFVGSDGFIQPATTNVPRFDHDPLSRQSLGLLSEVERRNLFIRSEEFSDAAWGKVNCSITSKSIAAPNGIISGSKLVENSGSGEKGLAQGVAMQVGLRYVFSLFVKAAERTEVRTQWSTGSGSIQFGAVNFNLTTQAITTSGNVDFFGVKSFGGGWFSIYGVTSQSTGTGSPSFSVLPLVNGATSYTGDGTSGIFIWGAQLEAGSTPSTYIPTTTTAVTRTADSAVIDGTGVLTGTYTMVEKPAGCAVVSGTNINLEPGFTAERVMVFPAALDAGQITAIRGAM
jgi:hypothetical protein